MYFLKFLSNFIEKSLKRRVKNAIEQSPWCRPQSPWNENQISLMSSRRGSHVWRHAAVNCIWTQLELTSQFLDIATIITCTTIEAANEKAFVRIDCADAQADLRRYSSHTA